MVWLNFPTAYSFLMISPNLHAIWVFLLLNLLLLLLNRMLPDITSNTWAKNIFIIFFITTRQFTIYNHGGVKDEDVRHVSSGCCSRCCRRRRQRNGRHTCCSGVRQVTGNDQDYLRESPEWLFRYLRFSKRATVGVRATYATR